MILDDHKKFDLPDSPGVYYFKLGKQILYVGKATSLRDRTRSYFGRDLILTRGPLLVKMVEMADTITFKTTQSVLEALILEAYEIKRLQPEYNRAEKDDKSYNFVVITDEKFPRILIERGRNLLKASEEAKFRSVFGPFPNGGQLRDALKIVRRIFPFRDKCVPKEELADLAKARPCFNRQIGLCPGVCTGDISAKDYKKTVRNIELFFSGQTNTVRKNLEREMKAFAKEHLFEKASEVKRTLFALDHIHDVSLIKGETKSMAGMPTHFRIEAYDIAHISGSATVGVMVVMVDGELAKNEYRKFRIRGEKGTVTVDDTKNLSEVLIRRLGHTEWPLPNLIVIDGGAAQQNIAKKTLSEKGFNIELVSVVKDERHKAREIMGQKSTVQKIGREITLLNAEAHRFAIAYHRLRRGKNLLT